MFTKLIIAVTTLVFSLSVGLGTANAFEPWNIRHYPGAPNGTTPMVTKVGATSTMTWSYEDSFGWNGVGGVISRALDTGSTDAESLGNVYNAFLRAENRGQITIRQAATNEAADMTHFIVPTAFLEAKCGTWATACVRLFDSVPGLPAYYKAASMITWPEISAKAVFRHETNHALARSCDQYRGGCPRADTGLWEPQVICTGNPDSLMDCGGAARTAQRFDYDTFVSAYPPTTAFLQQQVCGNPCWDGTFWVFTDGWKHKLNIGCGEWYNPEGVFTFGGCDNSWNGRWVPYLRDAEGNQTIWMHRGAEFFADGRWYKVP